MKADIFIPTSNRLDSLKNCLKSLNNQSLKSFHIILIGINHDPQILKLLKKFPNLKITYQIQKEKGLINAANEALKHSKNPIFIRIDDDVVISKNWYQSILQTFQTHKDIGGVTGPTIMSPQGIKSRDLTALLDRAKTSSNVILKVFYKIYYDFLYEKKLYKPSLFLESGVFTLGSNFPINAKTKNIIDVNNLEACNFAVRTDLLKKIKGFDTIYLKGLGDYHESDAALKIKHLGYRLVFNSKAKLYHRVESGKVDKARPAPYYRIQNFIIFYFRFFKFKNLTQFIKFLLNLSFQNLYYLYRFLTTGKINQLGAFPGSIAGLFKVIFTKQKHYYV